MKEMYPETVGVKVDRTDPLSEAYMHDLNSYLPDDLLKKVDMASMAHGLECRAPFLDHRFIEYAMSIPPHWKLRNNETKYLLKKAMEGHLPASVIRRKKQGFGVPIERWVRGDLKDMIADLLLHGSNLEDYLRPEEIKKIFDDAMNNDSSDWRAGFRLWILFMLELWMRAYLRPKVVT